MIMEYNIYKKNKFTLVLPKSGKYVFVNDGAIGKSNIKEKGMLKLWYYRNFENQPLDPHLIFRLHYKPEWLNDPLVKRMVKAIDSTEIISPHHVVSPVLGDIAPERLSGGVLTLILMLFDELGTIYDATYCGNNCAEWLLEVGKRKDVVCTLNYFMDFYKHEPFDIEIMNSNKVVHNMDELFENIPSVEDYVCEDDLI